MFNEFDQIFSDVFLSRSDFYQKALETLVNRYLEASKICQEAGYDLNNVTSDYLEELVQAGFISRDYTWHLKTNKASKLSHYRLRDNYIRFYLKYILPYRHKIKAGAFDNKSIGAMPGWNSIMGLQFENLVLNNRKRIWEMLQIAPDDIIWDNPFFQNKTVRQHGCQIDYLIQTKYSNLYVCEIKFYQTEVKGDVIGDVKQKIKNLHFPKGFSCRPVLIHVNGVHEDVIDSGYFSEIIDFRKLLET